MTSETNPNRDHAINDDADERCLLYLLGELSADQATAFERELEQDKRLQDELVSQSNLLCTLPNDQPTVVAADSPATHTSWRLAATVAAVAACLMIAFFAWPRAIDNEASVANAAPEGLLIAQAWADEPLSDLITDWHEPDNEMDDTFLPPEDDDSSLSWIVAAAEAGAVIDG